MKHNISKLMILTILVVSAQFATSGIRVILNGGGSAEMQALGVLNDLPKIMDAAHSMLGQLELTKEESKLFTALYQDERLRFKDYKLEFRDEALENTQVRYHRSDINFLSMPYNLLYNSSLEPLPFNKIATVIVTYAFTHNWLYPHKKDQIETLFTKVFSRLEVESKEFRFSSNYRLEVNRISLNQITSGILLYTKKKGHQIVLNSYLESLLPCDGGGAKILDLTDQAYYKGAATGVLKFQCLNEVYSGRMFLEIPEDFAARRDAFFEVKQVTSISNSCVNELVK